MDVVSVLLFLLTTELVKCSSTARFNVAVRLYDIPDCIYIYIYLYSQATNRVEEPRPSSHYHWSRWRDELR